MKYAVEIASGGVINVPSFMQIGGGVLTVLGFLTQQCWYY
jgi:hypothetical protein